MFELIFGSFFALIPTIILIIIIKVGGLNLFTELICGLFLVIGFVFIIKGLIRIIKNILTSRKGEECYGCVKDIKETGEYVNGQPIYKAEFIIYVESEYTTKEITEKIGMNPEKYPIGSYVKAKYYNNDINILDKIDDINIPEEIKQKIKVEVTPNNETIEIDGVKYKRMY